ncbi:MAG TPA: primosomal protein N', partial [Paracoccaceae bacterium]|nr:primosomal protein N' [Paracoccaceae bacterium]
MAEAELAPGGLVAVLTVEPLDRLLDYRVPEAGVELGAYVLVPLGPRQVLGVVWGPGEGTFDAAKIRPIARALDLPPMPAAMRLFLDRAADYTLTPRNLMLRLATRAPDLGGEPPPRRVYRPGTAEPGRMTPARTR